MSGVSAVMGTDTDSDRPPLRWRDGLAPTAAGWIVARALLLFANALHSWAMPRFDNPTLPGAPIGPLMWDGSWYQAIGERWYQGIPDEGARFFPVYPALGRLVSPAFGGDVGIALIVIANVTAFAGALVLWRLVAEVIDAGSSTGSLQGPGSASSLVQRLTGSAASRSAWMVAIAPSAFVFAWAYTEGLALLLGAATLLAVHRRKWLWAALFVLVAAALRPVGGLLLVPIAVELWQDRRHVRPFQAGVVLAAPFVGLIGAFVWIQSATGDLLLPLRAQQQIRGGFQDPFTRVVEPVFEMVTGDFRDAYNFGFMVVLIALFVVAVWRRQPPSWIAFAGVSLLITLSAQVTDSLGRYSLVVIPFIVALAQWADRSWRQLCVVLVGSAGFIWLTSEAMLYRMVP